jgi:hypothetical protein
MEEEMKFQRGEIYFVREQINGKDSKNVKIGLVNSPKTSEERLIQHRTGNPNHLYIANKIVTDAVHYVEKQLHKKYADKRISGEWFDLGNPDFFKKAIEDALSLSGDIAAKMPVITRAQSLDTEFDNLASVGPTDEIHDVAAELARSELFESGLKKLKKATMDAFKSTAEEEGTEVLETYFREITVYPKPKFDSTEFSDAEPEETVKKYTTFDEKLISDFSLLAPFKKSIGLGDAFNNQILEFTNSLSEATSASDLVDLYALLEKVETEQKTLEWPLTYLEAELKVFCNLSAGIDGIASWKRRVDMIPRIDEDRLYFDDSSLYNKYVTQADPYTKKIPTYRKPGR